jgi:hypothetical protein
VVGEGDEIHPPTPGLFVDRFRLGVAFPAEVAKDGEIRGPGVQGVNVEITAHRRPLSFPSRSSFNQSFNSAYIEGLGDCGKMKGRETFGDASATPLSRRRHSSVGP